MSLVDWIKTPWRYRLVRIKLMATHWGGVGEVEEKKPGSEAMSRMWWSTNCLPFPAWLSATHILGCQTRRWAESDGSRRLCVSSLDWWLWERGTTNDHILARQQVSVITRDLKPFDFLAHDQRPGQQEKNLSLEPGIEWKGPLKEEHLAWDEHA